MDKLKEDSRARSRSPIRKPPSEPRSDAEATSQRLWSDRDPSERVDYSAPISFASDEEQEMGEESSELVDVSEQT